MSACKSCMMEIPDGAKRCPHCTQPQGVTLGQIVAVLFIIGIVIAMIIVWWTAII